MNRRSLIASLIAIPLTSFAHRAKPAHAEPGAWSRIGARRLRANATALTFAGDFRGLNRLRLRAANQSVWIGGVALMDRQGRRRFEPVAKTLIPGASLALPGVPKDIAKVSVELVYLPFPGPAAELALWGAG